MIGHETIVYTVLNTAQRDSFIRQIYTNLTKEPDLTFTVEQISTNRINVYHNVNRAVNILIKVYLVVIVPLQIDITPISNICEGRVKFYHTEIITELKRLINVLESLEDTHFVKGNMNGKTPEELVNQLCGTDGKY